MEMGSSSSSSSSFSSTSDSLIGLKFGQKIYFEDVGAGVQVKSGGGSSSAGGGKPPPPPAKKGRSAVVQGGQPPRCQVEGCKVDLSDAKPYYSRHKVCGMHSKSPKVTVAGLEQRFCQQCSRFHLLPEFDQGKRSCRRRLAGHNERRRKPPPGSLFSSPYGRLSSSVFETSKGGGFVMDFSTYPKVTGIDPWPTIRAPNHVSSNQPTAMGKSLPNLWHSESANPQSNPFLQGSSSGTHYPGPTISSGEYFTGASNSGCALSLLSNQTWGSRDGSPSPFISVEGASMVQSMAANVPPVNHFPSVSWGLWGFKGNEGSSGSHEMPPHLGPSQISQPDNDQYHGELESAHQRQYVELEHSRSFDSSTQYMNWSL